MKRFANYLRFIGLTRTATLTEVMTVHLIYVRMIYIYHRVINHTFSVHKLTVINIIKLCYLLCWVKNARQILVLILFINKITFSLNQNTEI